MNVQEATPLTERRKGARRVTGEAPSTDEPWLVTRAKSGSSTAFGKLFELHRVRIYHTAFRILRNRQDAKSVEVCESALKRTLNCIFRILSDTSQSTRCGRCSSTFVSTRFHKPLQISRRLHLFH